MKNEIIVFMMLMAMVALIAIGLITLRGLIHENEVRIEAIELTMEATDDKSN